MPSDKPALPDIHDALRDPLIRDFLSTYIRRRLSAADADDVVQAVWVDALAAEKLPSNREDLRRWLVGVARHKIADFYRDEKRKRSVEFAEPAAITPAIEAQDLAQWAEEQVGSTKEDQAVLRWMAREGDGEKLEAIAEEEKIPAPRLRKRISRMRRFMRERWIAELAVLTTLILMAFVAWKVLQKTDVKIEAKPEELPAPETTISIAPSPEVLASQLREEAFKLCEEKDWVGCLRRLDAAKKLDPKGDQDPNVVAARERATQALKPSVPKDVKPAPSPKQPKQEKSSPQKKVPSKEMK